ncbi:anti-sigma factor family protein [Paenibacillus sepulcri]
MEYMQRELDGDLDDRETEILMTHTRHCPECTAVFEKLKLLSAGLDNLPKVTPSYSLVDAIMPRLLELQTAQSAELAADPSQEEEQEALAPRRVQGGRSQERRKSRFSTRIMGGVIAAGIVVGLIFITNPFEGTNSLNDSANSGTMTADTSSADTASRKMTVDENAQDSNTPKADDEVRVSGNNADAKDNAASSQAAGGSAESSPIANNMQTQEDPASKDIAGSGSPANGEDGAAPSNDPGNSQGQSLYNESGSGNAGGEADAPADPPAPAAGMPAPGGEDTLHNQILSSQDPQALSPDKLYNAAVVDKALKIFNTADNEMIFQGAERDGITNLKWSSDSKTITYESTAADGKKQEYVVDLAASSEKLKTN